MSWGIFRKLTLTVFLILTAINFVHVNGRTLYVDWRMVVMVEEGNVLHHVTRERELSGRWKCRGDMSRGMSGFLTGCPDVQRS